MRTKGMKWVWMGMTGWVLIIGLLVMAAKPKEPSDKERIQNLESVVTVLVEEVQTQHQAIELMNQRTWDLRMWIEELGGDQQEQEPDPAEPNHLVSQ